MYSLLVSTTNLPVGSTFDMRAVHGTRRGPFEIDALAVISAAMTGALEFVFRRFPFRRAAQVRAASENDEDSVRLADHPDAIGHAGNVGQSPCEIGWITDIENCVGFVERPGKKKRRNINRLMPR